MRCQLCAQTHRGCFAQLGEMCQAWQNQKKSFWSVCLTFSPFCLRNDVEIALSVSFWRDLTAEQRSEAGKREWYLLVGQQLQLADWPYPSAGESSQPYLLLSAASSQAS